MLRKAGHGVLGREMGGLGEGMGAQSTGRLGK
jgi:hypothetical protein